MSDDPVPVPKPPIAERILEAAQSTFPHLCFEVFEDERVELFCVTSIVEGEASRGEMSRQDATVVDPDVAAGDELLFLFATVDDTVQAEHVFDGICAALGLLLR